ncbi:MAG TPA: hypothetical protein VI522_04985, partial [Gammaproteobacteria bacterium]|nr:hypothetical protein [Gammaproteobacteria bacterium]
MPTKIEISLAAHTPKQKNHLRHRFYQQSTRIATWLSDTFYISAFFNWLFYFNLDDYNFINQRIKDGTKSKEIPHLEATAAANVKENGLTLLQRAVFSGNTLVAALGLNFAYVIVHLATLWGFHAVWLTAATIGLIALPITIYVALSISDAINAVKRNLIYEQRKRNKNAKIKLLKAKLRPLLGAVDKLVFDPSDHYHALTKFYTAQSFFEALKKLTRTTMLFTIIFVLEIATGIPLEYLITSIASGVAILIVDWRAQRKESRHDLKLRELHEQIVVLTQKYLELKRAQPQLARNTEAQTFAIDRLTNYLRLDTPTPAPLEISWIKSKFRTYILNPFNRHLLAWDNALAFVGVTSAYVAFGFITLFNIHTAELLDTVLMFALPGVFALVIAFVNIYVNNKLHQSYELEEVRLKNEIRELKMQTLQLLNEHSFNPDIISKLTEYFDRTSKDLWIKEYCQDNKKWYKEKEAFKKLSRILTMSFLFLGAGALLTPVGIGIVIGIGLIIAGIDYLIRKGKEEKEAQLKTLQMEQKDLLKVQEILVENIATQPGLGINLCVEDPSNNNASAFIPAPGYNENAHVKLLKPNTVSSSGALA